MSAPRWIAAVAAALIAASNIAACDLTTRDQTVDLEDCDAEDYRNREDDCGFTDADRKKVTPTRKPAPRPTRR